MWRSFTGEGPECGRKAYTVHIDTWCIDTLRIDNGGLALISLRSTFLLIAS